MDIKIYTIQFDADEKLLSFTHKKVKKITDTLDGVVGAEVFLTYNKSKPKHTNNKTAKIKLEVPGHDLFAEKEGNTFEEAVDQSIDALKKQIEKHKSKLR